MKISCGTDIIEIERIKKSIQDLGEKFLQKIYTKKEIEYCESKHNQKYQHYAARFAVKEAVFKAISEYLPTTTHIDWKSIEVENDKKGKPHVTVHGVETTMFQNIEISISHCKEYAVAYAIVIIK